MTNIKVKESKKRTIKTINKTFVGTEKIKNRIIETKEKIKEQSTQENTSEKNYEIEKINNEIKNTPYITRKINKYGKENFVEINKNINIANKKIKYAKKRNHARNVAKNIIKGSKQSKNGIKTAERTGKNIKVTTKTTSKASQRTVKVTKEMIKKTVKKAKLAIKAIITSAKAIIAGTKALITAIIAGAWVVVIIVILICLIAMLCNSILGIFLSNEGNIGNKTMNSVINEINTEFTNRITEIQNANEHDDFEISSNRAEWKDVISIYAVLISNGEEQCDVMILDNSKIEKLKSAFWEMNIITSRIENVEKEIETFDEEGNRKIEIVNRKILYIDITSKSVEEMIQQYNLNNKQVGQLLELRKDEYNSMWYNLLYGSSTGSTDIVQVALSQIGNIGGQPFWSWYGYNSRVEWCACFVSWCANECGYINTGIIPKFANCQNEGVAWFKTCGLWQERGYFPKSGDIIFFDWADSNDRQADHVGIVEKYENGKVYTIEGNTKGDVCKQNVYDVNSDVILGYGTPKY